MAEFQGKLDKKKYPCIARMNCWLLRGREWCAICKEGNKAKWRARCDEERKAQGTPSYAEALESAQKSFGAISGQEAK